MEIVNGFVCKDCTDVEYAKKNIDPAHPKDGRVDAPKESDAPKRSDPAVLFGGALAALNDAPRTSEPRPPQTGRKLDVTA
ncbi:MAG TPA: hypothetical protein VIO94_02745 [Phenylobacterium sp.]